jgi:hypothetical protein
VTKALSDAVGGCRSWKQHDPGKVVRDIVLTLADGGDALRHLNVLTGQSELFGSVASASTANRTLVALGDDEWSSSGWPTPAGRPGGGCGTPVGRRRW